MFKKWWVYEWARIKRAATEANFGKWFGGGFLVGLFGDGLRYATSLRTEHDTFIYIAISIACAVVGALCAFLFKLLFLPAKMATEQQDKYDSTVREHKDEIELINTSNSTALQKLQDDNRALTEQIQTLHAEKNENEKLKITAHMETRNMGIMDLNHSNPVVNTVFVNVVNLGRQTVMIYRVVIQTDTTIDNTGVVELKPHGDLKEWKFPFDTPTQFKTHERGGRQYCDGYIQLTSGKRYPFEFVVINS